MTNSKHRIVITGIGPITPVGIGKENIYEGVLNQKNGLTLRETKLGNDVWDKSYIHLVNNFNIDDFQIDQDDLNYIKNWKEGEHNKDLLFLLAAVKLALQDSRIDWQTKNNNISLIATHENPGLEQCLMKTYSSAHHLFKQGEDLSEKNFYNEIFKNTLKVGYESQSFMMLFHIARTFNINKYSLLINNACASGLYAIESAADLIKLGKSKQVIVVAGDCPDVFKTIWLKSINMYKDDGKTKPFDSQAKGFVMGEGAVALIIEDYEEARKRGAPIYAEYLGGGFTLEGWGVTTPMIGGHFYQDAIEEALKTSQVNKNDLDLICAHGVGTTSSDYYEAKAITDVFGALKIPVTALKPFLGHNLGGSTLIEMAVLLLHLRKKRILPILNTNNPNPKLGLDLVLEERGKEVKLFMKTCCAFAGYNAASIFKVNNEE